MKGNVNGNKKWNPQIRKQHLVPKNPSSKWKEKSKGKEIQMEMAEERVQKQT